MLIQIIIDTNENDVHIAIEGKEAKSQEVRDLVGHTIAKAVGKQLPKLAASLKGLEAIRRIDKDGKKNTDASRSME